MDKEEIQKEIMNIMYLYELKGIIRYAESRDEKVKTQSVAEHVYGMMILAEHFLPLEDPAGEMDREKLYRMIIFHDVDEIETGDIPTYHKTNKDRENAIDSLPTVFSKISKYKPNLLSS